MIAALGDAVAAVRRALATPRAKRVLKVLRYLFTSGLIVWLLVQLHAIGWREVATSLPTTPLFYLFFVASFLVLPVSERLIFGVIWPASPRADIPALLRKRALNSMVVSYSGDLFFFWWAKTRMGLPERRVLAGIKDSTILSGIASGVINAALAVAFFASGSAELVDRVLAGHRAGLYALLAGLVFLVPVFLKFRRRILWIDSGQATKVFAVHVVRNLVVLLLQLAQWAVVLPQVPVETWLLFLTVQMLINNLPLIPNRDILFLVVGVSIVGEVGVDRAPLASMFVAMSFLRQLANLLVLLVTSVLPGARMPAQEAAAR